MTDAATTTTTEPTGGTPPAAGDTKSAHGGTPPTTGDTKPAAGDTKPTEGDGASKSGQETDSTLVTKKGDDTGDGDGSVKAPSVPETYEFRLPEGWSNDDALLGEAAPIFKEIGLSQESAQKVVDLIPKVLERQQQAWMDAHADQQKAWQQEVRNDKDLGGGNFEANHKIVSKAWQRFGSTDLEKVLNETGLGNHPEVFRFFLNVGKAIAEDAPGAGSASRGTDDPLKKLYGQVDTDTPTA